MKRAIFGKFSLIIIPLALIVFAVSLLYMKWNIPGERAALERLAAAEARQGPGDVLQSLYDLSLVYYINDRPDLAAPVYERITALEEKAMGTEDPRRIRSLLELGAAYDVQGEYSRADPVYDRIATLMSRSGDARGYDREELARRIEQTAVKLEQLFARHAQAARLRQRLDRLPAGPSSSPAPSHGGAT